MEGRAVTRREACRIEGRGDPSENLGQVDFTQPRDFLRPVDVDGYRKGRGVGNPGPGTDDNLEFRYFDHRIRRNLRRDRHCDNSEHQYDKTSDYEHDFRVDKAARMDT